MAVDVEDMLDYLDTLSDQLAACEKGWEQRELEMRYHDLRDELLSLADEDEKVAELVRGAGLPA